MPSSLRAADAASAFRDVLFSEYEDAVLAEMLNVLAISACDTFFSSSRTITFWARFSRVRDLLSGGFDLFHGPAPRSRASSASRFPALAFDASWTDALSLRYAGKCGGVGYRRLDPPLHHKCREGGRHILRDVCGGQGPLA